MWRDTYVYLKDIHTHIINYVILAPIILGFCFAYLQKNIYFGTQEIERGTCLFLGSITAPLLYLAFKIMVELLLDLEGKKFINYQLGILPARILLVQRIVFASLYTFLLTIPYFPVVKLILGNNLATTNASWISFIVLMYVSSLCCASYTMLAMCVLSVETLGSFWIRVNWVLMNLGGFWVPLAVIKQFSPILGFLAYFNPLLYMMEGTRSTILGTTIFISAFYCMVILLAFSMLFIILSWYFFKKRIDHI
jgi:ABC-type multidrug transport system permease subunit